MMLDGLSEPVLTGVTITSAGRSGVHLSNCQLAGMRIDGVLVLDLLDADRGAQ